MFPAGPNITSLRGVGPRWAWEAGSSPVPAYASTSVRRRLTPLADTVQPRRLRAAVATCAAGIWSHRCVMVTARVPGGLKIAFWVRGARGQRGHSGPPRPEKLGARRIRAGYFLV